MRDVINIHGEDEQVLKRKNERILRNLKHVSQKYLRHISELPGIPNSLDYFVNILKRIHVENKGVERSEGIKTVGTFCVMVPQELIYAAGCIPVKLCSGSYTAYNIGDEIAPRDSCPLVKSTIGFSSMKLMPVYDECSLLVVPTSCDCKKKMAFMLEKYNKVVPLHVPTSKLDDESKNYYIEDIYSLKNILENITSKKITYGRLKTAVEAVACAQYEIFRLYSLKMNHPPVIKGTHALAVLNSYSYDRIDRWTNALRILNDELALRVESKKYVSKPNAPRIMVTGSPIVFPNIKIPLLIEEMGGVFVADETCMGERGMYDPAVVTENTLDGLMRAIAVKSILPCTCPSFVNNDQRIFRIKQMIEDFKVQGVIYHVLRGCLVYDFEFMVLEDVLRSMDIPVIRVETDYNEEDVEQIRVRIEAFIEMIKFRSVEEK